MVFTLLNDCTDEELFADETPDVKSDEPLCWTGALELPKLENVGTGREDRLDTLFGARVLVPEELGNEAADTLVDAAGRPVVSVPPFVGPTARLWGATGDLDPKRSEPWLLEITLFCAIPTILCRLKPVPVVVAGPVESAKGSLGSDSSTALIVSRKLLNQASS